MSRKCPFAAPLIKGDFGCSHAEEVVRRGGLELDCRFPGSHERCMALFERLKQAALPAFEVEDDLASMPHSVLVKIQYGGLLGLARLSAPGRAPESIKDVSHMVSGALERFGSVAGVPFGELVGDMTAYRLQRKTRRR